MKMVPISLFHHFSTIKNLLSFLFTLFSSLTVIDRNMFCLGNGVLEPLVAEILVILRELVKIPSQASAPPDSSTLIKRLNKLMELKLLLPIPKNCCVEKQGASILVNIEPILPFLFQIFPFYSSTVFWG